MSGGGSEDLWVPPGWYQDPYNAAFLRYWDGQHWTRQLVPAPPGVPARPSLGGAGPFASASPGGKLARTALGAGALVLLVAVLGRMPSPIATGAAAGTTTTGATTRSGATGHRTPPSNVSPTAGGDPAVRLPTTGAHPSTHAGRPSPGSSRPPTAGPPTPARPAPNALVPDVVSRDVAAARAALEQAGFAVRVTTRTVAQGVEGTVLAQTPAAGSTRPVGSVVKIVLAHVRTPSTKGKPNPPASPSPSKKASAPR